MTKDIRISVSFFDHHKTKKLSKKCGPDAIICLLRLWGWCAENRSKGVFTNMDEDDIELASGWNGDDGKFVDCCLSIGWLDMCENKSIMIHDWEENQPWVFFSEERSAKSKKAAKARWEKRLSGNDECNSYAGSNASGMPEVCYEHKDSKASGNAPLPSPLPSPLPLPSPTPKGNKRFTPPSFLDVKEYCLERKNGIDPQAFLDHYATTGWMKGKNKIKDWKACVRTWEKNEKNNKPNQPSLFNGNL